MGNICPFLPREGENYQHCLGEKCYLFNKGVKNCLFSGIDLSKATNVKAIQEAISSSSQSTNDLIKKIGGLLTKQSKPIMEYLDTIKNGKAVLEALGSIQTALQAKTSAQIDPSLMEETVKIRTALEEIMTFLGKAAHVPTQDNSSVAHEVVAVSHDYQDMVQKIDTLINVLTSSQSENSAGESDNITALLKDINEVNKTAYKGLYTLVKTTMSEHSELLKSLHQFVTGTQNSASATSENEIPAIADTALLTCLRSFEPLIDFQQKMHSAVMDVSNALFETKEEILGIHNNIKDYQAENQTQIRTFMENVNEWLHESQKNSGNNDVLAELHETLKQMIKNFGSLGINIAQIEQKIFDKNDELVTNSAKIGKALIETIAKTTEQVQRIAQKQEEQHIHSGTSFEAVLGRFDKLIAIQEQQTDLLTKMEQTQQKTVDVLHVLVEKIEPLQGFDAMKASVESLSHGNEAFQKTLVGTAEKMLEVSSHQEKYMQSEINAYKFRKADELNTLAVALLLDKDYSGAIEKSKNAIELYPTLWGAYNTLGMAYAESGEKKKAVEVFKNVISQNSDYSEAYYNLGVIMARDKEFEKAIGLYKVSIEKNSSFINAYRALGDALEENGSLEGALKAWERACMLDPTQTDLIEKVAKYKEVSTD